MCRLLTQALTHYSLCYYRPIRRINDTICFANGFTKSFVVHNYHTLQCLLKIWISDTLLAGINESFVHRKLVNNSILQSTSRRTFNKKTELTGECFDSRKKHQNWWRLKLKIIDFYEHNSTSSCRNEAVSRASPLYRCLPAMKPGCLSSLMLHVACTALCACGCFETVHAVACKYSLPCSSDIHTLLSAWDQMYGSTLRQLYVALWGQTL